MELNVVDNNLERSVGNEPSPLSTFWRVRSVDPTRKCMLILVGNHWRHAIVLM